MLKDTPLNYLSVGFHNCLEHKVRPASPIETHCDEGPKQTEELSIPIVLVPRLHTKGDVSLVAAPEYQLVVNPCEHLPEVSARLEHSHKPNTSWFNGLWIRPIFKGGRQELALSRLAATWIVDFKALGSFELHQRNMPRGSTACREGPEAS